MLGLLNTASQGVETAFKVAEEFVRLGTYTKKTGNGVYDPTTDSMDMTTIVTEDVRFLQTSLTREEREASPLSIQDFKFIVPAVDLPDLDPGENDTISFPGEELNVLASKFVPGKVVHIIFARRA